MVILLFLISSFEYFEPWVDHTLREGGGGGSLRYGTAPISDCYGILDDNLAAA